MDKNGSLRQTLRQPLTEQTGESRKETDMLSRSDEHQITAVGRMLELLASGKEKENLMRALHKVFNDLGNKLTSREDTAVLVLSESPDVTTSIIEHVKARFGERKVVIFDFRPEAAQAINTSVQLEERLSNLKGHHGDVIFLVHPESTLSQNGLNYLRAQVSHEEVFRHNRTVLITTSQEYERNGGRAFNIYARASYSRELAKMNAPSEFDAAQANRLVDHFAEVCQALQDGNLVEFHLGANGVRLAFLEAFENWWMSDVYPLLDSLAVVDYQRFKDKEEGFEKFCNTVNYHRKRLKHRVDTPLILVNNNSLGESQKQELGETFPDTKLILLD